MFVNTMLISQIFLVFWKAKAFGGKITWKQPSFYFSYRRLFFVDFLFKRYYISCINSFESSLAYNNKNSRNKFFLSLQNRLKWATSKRLWITTRLGPKKSWQATKIISKDILNPKAQNTCSLAVRIREFLLKQS